MSNDERPHTRITLTTMQAQPEMGRIRLACATFGLSRTGIYREAAKGNILLRKIGGRTLVDFASVRKFLSDLPAAYIRPPRAAIPDTAVPPVGRKSLQRKQPRRTR